MAVLKYYNGTDWVPITGTDASAVHTTGTETVAGVKTFTSTIQAANGINLGNSNVIRPLVFNSSTSGSKFTQLYPTTNNSKNFKLYLPSANGTLATTDDIPSLSGYATEDWVSTNYQTKGNYLTAHQSLAGCVPYSGATQDVNIEGHDFWADDIYSQGDLVATQNWVSNQGYLTSNSLNGYLPLSGGTLTGSLQIYSTGSSWNEGVRLHAASNGWSGVVFCDTANTGDTGSSVNTWSIHNYEGIFGAFRNGSTIDNVSVGFAHDGSNWQFKGGDIYVNSSGRLAYASEIPSSLPANGGNSDTVDGYHASSFFGRSTINEDARAFGSAQLNGTLPSGLSGVYNYGTYLSFAQTNSVFEVYAPHLGTGTDRIWVRTGWNDDRQAWKGLAFTNDIPSSLPASDVYGWAKESTKPTYTASEVGALGNYGDSPNSPAGAITQPSGANAVSMRTGTTSGRDVGIFRLSDDNAYICNSSDNSYTFAVFDTDHTLDFSSADNAAFVVLSDHSGVSMAGNLTVAGSISENGNSLADKYQAKGNYAGTSVATTSANGLMSATDKTNLDAIVASLNNDDTDSTVNRLKDVLSVFNDYPEGTTVLSALNSKLSLSGGTLQGSSTDTPLYIRNAYANNSHGGYIGFQDTAGVTRGYLSINASSQPVIYTDSDHRIALYEEIPSSLPANGGSADYATSAGSAGYVSQAAASPDVAVPGTGIKGFYSWNTGNTGNSTEGYSVGLTVGSHPGDQNYGFQIAQNLWDDRLYVRRYNSGYGSWYTVAYTSDLSDMATQTWVGNQGYLTVHQDISGKLDKSGGTITGTLTVGSYTTLEKSVNIGKESASAHLLFFSGDSNNAHYTILKGQVVSSATTVKLPTADGTLATQEWVQNQGYLTAHQSLSGYATESWVSTNYQPKGNYLTEHQSLSSYATQSWVGDNYQAKGNYLTSHKTYYEHNILIFVATNGYFINLRLINDSATALTTYAGLASALNSAGYTSNLKTLLCSGSVYASGKTMMATGIFVQSSSTICVRGVTLAQRSSSTLTINESPSAFSSTTLSSSSFNIQDYVRTL